MTIRHVIYTAALTVALTGSAYAQNVIVNSDTAVSIPGHPRVSEVDTRLNNQQQRIDAGVANGTITPEQAARDEKHDDHIAARLSADQAKNGGHITAAEDAHLNKSLNKNSKRIKE